MGVGIAKMLGDQERADFIVDEILTAAEKEPLVQFIADKTGIVLREKDWMRLQNFLQKRFAHLGIHSGRDYCDRLQASYQRLQDSTVHRFQEEWTLLMQEITNGESYFFRDPSQLNLICETLLPKIIAKRTQAFNQGLIEQPYINIWSAGCSTGEEPHSLAMLIQENYPELKDWQFNLIATDINPQAIAQGQGGKYRDWSLREISLKRRSRYFQKVGSTWQIKPELSDSIQWDILNLKEPQAIAKRIPWASMDIILCRNVFIYFDPATIQGIVKQFNHCLNPDGYLVVGHAELEGQDLSQFHMRYEIGSVVYQPKRGHTQAPSIPELSLSANVPSASNPTLQKKDVEVNWEKIENLLQGNYFKTLKAKLSQIPAQDQESFPFYWLKARLAFNQDGLEEAQRFANKALTCKPQSIDVLHLLIEIAQQQQRWDAALSDIRKVIYLEPENISAHIKLMEIYEALGKKSKAQKALLQLEQLIQPLTGAFTLNHRQYRTVDQLKSHLAWKKIRHPFHRSLISS